MSSNNSTNESQTKSVFVLLGKDERFLGIYNTQSAAETRMVQLKNQGVDVSIEENFYREGNLCWKTFPDL